MLATAAAAAVTVSLGGCSEPGPPDALDVPEASDTDTLQPERLYACAGAPATCDTPNRTGSGHCGLQAGCYWRDDTDSCDGLAGPCGYFRRETSCADQAGCAWIEVAAHFDNTPSKGCSGSVEPCSAATASQCADRIGCAWDDGLPGCYGETVICAHRYAVTLCERGAGCAWRPLQ